jgi:hypothetical protein
MTKEKVLEFDSDKCTSLYEDLVEVFKKHAPTVGEILIAYGNLGYTLGSSIGGYKTPGPGLEELNQIYYTDPSRLDAALMITGIQICTWYSDYEELLLSQEKKQET